LVERTKMREPSATIQIVVEAVVPSRLIVTTSTSVALLRAAASAALHVVVPGSVLKSGSPPRCVLPPGGGRCRVVVGVEHRKMLHEGAQDAP
jgi:hypothetical protein